MIIDYKHFTDASRLRRFNFDLLHRFLLPFRDYLADKHGFRWTDNFLTFPYDDLVPILSQSDDEIPELFKTGLFFIDELSNYKGTELIFYQLSDAGISVDNSVAREDIALFAWLHDPKILQSVHPELAALRPKRFEKYVAVHAHSIFGCDQGVTIARSDPLLCGSQRKKTRR